MGGLKDKATGKKTALPAASEVFPRWFIGGRYSDEVTTGAGARVLF